MTEVQRHIPVMLPEVMQALSLKPGGVAVDCTLGLASHSLAMAESVGESGVLVATDWDQQMLADASKRLESTKCRKELRHADYREVPRIMAELSLRADGILADLGVNSVHFDDAQYGMSVTKEGPLDMRMNRAQGEPASALLNRMSLSQIDDMLHDYGDERWSKAIARVIVDRRKQAPLQTTTDLVEAVLAAIPVGARDKRIHPATRTFQAVRIAVNREIDGLEEAIEDISKCLAKEGTFVVLAYHSGEDRCVKNAFKNLAKSGDYIELTKKPEGPSADEIARNPRSRSAKMRALRRVA